MSKNPTEEQLKEILARVAGGGGDAQRVMNMVVSDIMWKEASMKAKAANARPDRFNKTERAYSQHLDLLKAAGEVLHWGFESVTLRLGDDCRLTMDFFVLNKDGQVELHDCKAKWGKKLHVEDDAKAKTAIAASTLFPFFVFKFVWKDGPSWQHKTL